MIENVFGSGGAGAYPIGKRDGRGTPLLEFFRAFLDIRQAIGKLYEPSDDRF